MPLIASSCKRSSTRPPGSRHGRCFLLPRGARLSRRRTAERPREAFAAEDISVASSFFIALLATLPCSSYATAREDFAFGSTFLTSCFLNTIASPVSTERRPDTRSVGHCQARSQAIGPPHAQSTHTSLGSNEPSQPSRASIQCRIRPIYRSAAHGNRLIQRLIRRSRSGNFARCRSNLFAPPIIRDLLGARRFPPHRARYVDNR